MHRHLAYVYVEILVIPLLDGNVEKRVANMTDELWEILSLMGKNAKNIMFDERHAESEIHGTTHEYLLNAINTKD